MQGATAGHKICITQPLKQCALGFHYVGVRHPYLAGHQQRKTTLLNRKRIGSTPMQPLHEGNCSVTKLMNRNTLVQSNLAPVPGQLQRPSKDKALKVFTPKGWPRKQQPTYKLAQQQADGIMHDASAEQGGTSASSIRCAWPSIR